MSARGGTLPTLDLRDFHSPRHAEFLAQLRTAAREVGFFYLVGHGVDAGFLAQLLALSKRFFALPEADKAVIEMANSPHFRGYTRLGDERTRGAADWREQLDIGLELEALPLPPDAPSWQRLPGPNQWPAQLPELRPAFERAHRELYGVAARLLNAFAAALGQSEDVFESVCRGRPWQMIKTIHYPGSSATAQGVGAHKDGEFVTLLLQDAVSGLQVQGEDGHWIDAPPLPGSFVVNTGELLEMASDGYLRATTHRVLAPPPGMDRYAIAFFLSACLDARVPRLRLPPALAGQARGPACDPSNPLLEDVGINTLKGRLRSHPDVARRYYPDTGGT
jgi:isopenicillin N synthase-like dioxygenase